MLESDLDIEVDPSNAFFFNPKCEILYDDQNNRLAIIDASEFIHQIRAELAPGVEPASGSSQLHGLRAGQGMCLRPWLATWTSSCQGSLTCSSASAWIVPPTLLRNRNLGWASVYAPGPALMKRKQSIMLGSVHGILNLLSSLLPCQSSMILSSVSSRSQSTHGFSVPCMPTCHRLGLVSCLVIGLEFKSCSKLFIDRV